ncbi:hypothetical protein GQ53DRAFT_870878 [Thozetella sp. PMI_491]|nr:hypothetical protein GQ53DRAFT_870878 [Thozetella sp. PMI_491]
MELSTPGPKMSLVVDRTAIYRSFFLSEFNSLAQEHGSFVFQRFRRGFSLLEDAQDKRFSNSLPYAAEALASGYFARRHTDVRSRNKSILAYGKSLQCISAQLVKARDLGFESMVDEEWDDFHFSSFSLGLWEILENIVSAGKMDAKKYESGIDNWSYHKGPGARSTLFSMTWLLQQLFGNSSRG